MNCYYFPVVLVPADRRHQDIVKKLGIPASKLVNRSAVKPAPKIQPNTKKRMSMTSQDVERSIRLRKLKAMRA